MADSFLVTIATGIFLTVEIDMMGGLLDVWYFLT